MGLFGSRKKTYVGTVVQRVIEDDAIPDSPKLGAIKGILNNGDVVDYILDEILGSVGPKSDRMYDYAVKNYPYGVPTKTFHRRDKGKADIQNILNQIHGDTVKIDYSVFGPANFNHVAWIKLIQDHAYDPDTNEITSLNEGEDRAWLESFTIVIPEETADEYQSGALERLGTSAKAGYKPWEPNNPGLPKVIPQPPVMTWQGAPNAWITVNYGRYEMFEGIPTDKVIYSFFNMDVTEYENEESYFHVKYTVGEKTYFWMYRQGAGTYPVLDDLFENNQNLGQFYPMTYLRYEKKPMNLDKTTPEYKASRKMMKYLGLDYDSLIDAVHENPDVADVEQAFITFGIPANTEVQIEQNYLYNFFDQMHTVVGGVPPSTSPYGTFGSIYNTEVVNAVVIRDSMFKMALNTSGLQKFRRAGIIAKVGEYNSGFGTMDITVDRIDQEGNPYTATVPLDYHYYRKQVSDTLYDEVRVYNMKMVYHVYGSYTTTGDDEDAILLVPLDKTIVDTFSLPQKEDLISRALNFVFNSVTVVKLKWYQTGIFKAFMVIVAIIITVLTYGAAWQALAGAIAAGGTLAVLAIQTALIGVLKSIVTAYAFKLFVKEVGGDFALFIAIVAIAYGGYQVAKEGLGSNVWANNLLQVGNGLTKAVGNFYNDALQGLQKEYQDFLSISQRMEEDLKDASDALMGSTVALNPFVIFGEKPTDYYNRTVHSGNIGLNTITAVSNYVDVALRLPTIDETL